MSATAVPAVHAHEDGSQSTPVSHHVSQAAPIPAAPPVTRPTSSRPRLPRKRQTPPQTPWQSVPLHCLQPHTSQPRQQFDIEALNELSESIKAHGVLQPILVRPISGDDDIADTPRYEIVAGERRFRASQQAGLIEIPVLVQQLDGVAAAEISLIENLQRADLAPLETAAALLRMHEQGYSVRKLAAQLGKGKGWVEQRLLLARLPQDLQAMVSGRPDTLTHARELAKVADAGLRAELVAAVQDSVSPMPLTELRKHIRDATPLTETSPAAESLESEDAVDLPADDDADEGLTDEGLSEAVLSNESLDGDAPETEALETEQVASAEDMLFQETLVTRLSALKRRLPALPPPACRQKRARIVAELADARAAIDATLARWKEMP